MSRGRARRSKQGDKENAKIEQKMMWLGERYVKMENRLERYPKRVLLDEANLVMRQTTGLRIDRLALRHRKALICWFAEFDFDQIYRTELRIHSGEYAPSPPHPQRSIISVDSTASESSISASTSTSGETADGDSQAWDDAEDCFDDHME
jgi:hypothetical protein